MDIFAGSNGRVVVDEIISVSEREGGYRDRSVCLHSYSSIKTASATSVGHVGQVVAAYG